MQNLAFLSHLKDILRRSQTNNYIGENVTQLEHFILAAQEAEQEYPTDIELIVAAFLHDIGHQLKDLDMVSQDGEILGVKNHEIIGAQFLKNHGFSEKICIIVANHVKAKRYLAYTDPTYIEKLSNASRQTFILQNGMMSPSEAQLFENEKYFKESILIRHYDDRAKDITQLKMSLWEAFDHYFELTSLVLKNYKN